MGRRLGQQFPQFLGSRGPLHRRGRRCYKGRCHEAGDAVGEAEHGGRGAACFSGARGGGERGVEGGAGGLDGGEGFEVGEKVGGGRGRHGGGIEVGGRGVKAAARAEL